MNLLHSTLQSLTWQNSMHQMYTTVVKFVTCQKCSGTDVLCTQTANVWSDKERAEVRLFLYSSLELSIQYCDWMKILLFKSCIAWKSLSFHAGTLWNTLYIIKRSLNFTASFLNRKQTQCNPTGNSVCQLLELLHLCLK